MSFTTCWFCGRCAVPCHAVQALGLVRATCGATAIQGDTGAGATAAVAAAQLSWLLACLDVSAQQAAAILSDLEVGAGGQTQDAQGGWLAGWPCTWLP